jgi:uncharacterized membrane protein YfcA
MAVSTAAGLLGSLLGIGGGIIVVPTLTLLLGVDIRFAIGASIVSVIATSSGAAVTYVKNEIANVKLAMLLEVATVAGALSGAFLVGWIPQSALYLLFGLLLFFVAFVMATRKNVDAAPAAVSERDLNLARRLSLESSYDDARLGEVSYVVTRVPQGLAGSALAGVISGLLGVGGGIIKVPLMNMVMGVPMKVSTATSNLMIGVTAAASALVYFARGDVNPYVAGPVALGILLGAQLGSRLMSRIESRIVIRVFVLVLFWVGAQMCWKWWNS